MKKIPLLLAVVLFPLLVATADAHHCTPCVPKQRCGISGCRPDPWSCWGRPECPPHATPPPAPPRGTFFPNVGAVIWNGGQGVTIRMRWELPVFQPADPAYTQGLNIDAGFADGCQTHSTLPNPHDGCVAGLLWYGGRRVPTFGTYSPRSIQPNYDYEGYFTLSRSWCMPLTGWCYSGSPGTDWYLYGNEKFKYILCDLPACLAQIRAHLITYGNFIDATPSTVTWHHVIP
jgi:hypothetical protein